MKKLRYRVYFSDCFNHSPELKRELAANRLGFDTGLYFEHKKYCPYNRCHLYIFLVLTK